MSDSRTKAIQLAVSRWAEMDASSWDTGLSPEGANLAQYLAAAQITNADFRTLPSPPKRLLIWCSANVFTAPLEWVAQFAAMGTEVVLKAPSDCPQPALAMAEAFSDLGVTAHKVDLDEAFTLLPSCDAVLGFGSDGSMTNLETHIGPNVPRSLHGHKGSLAIVKAEDPDACAEALIQDAILYDGRGCMSPVAVFCIGNAEALYNSIQEKGFQPPTPLGQISLAESAHTSRRIAIADLVGRGPDTLPTRHFQPSEFHHGEERFHNNVKPLLLGIEEFEFLSIPRLLPIHPFFTIDDLDFLKGLPWSSCATDLPHADLAHLGFHRFCAPGELQRPALNRKHDGVDVLSRLCGGR